MCVGVGLLFIAFEVVSKVDWIGHGMMEFPDFLSNGTYFLWEKLGKL